jgi:hypothetical protein
MTGLQGEFLIDGSQVGQAIMDARERRLAPSSPDAPTINPLDPMENGIFAIVKKLGLKLEAANPRSRSSWSTTSTNYHPRTEHPAPSKFVG